MTLVLRTFARTSLALSVLGALGCAELDISHEPPVDFSRYRSVTAQVLGDFESESDYLAAELRDVSGFTTVVVAPPSSEERPSTPATDAYLEVEISLGYYHDSDGFVRFVADASYELRDAEEALLTSDTVSDEGGTARAAVRRALDEVAFDFLPAYDY